MLVFIGLLSGIVSGLGMGGGTVLIIILTNLLHIDQHIAQANNLIFFIPTSIMAIIVNIKNKNINYKIAIKMIPICILGATIGALFSKNFDSERLKRFFGIFLFCIGVYEIIITVKNKVEEKKNSVK